MRGRDGFRMVLLDESRPEAAILRSQDSKQVFCLFSVQTTLGGTVTAGIVSAQGRDIGSGLYDNYIQIDAPINKGNSGGPAFDTKGKVIGVNTAIYSPSGGSVGIGFDVPAQTAKAVVEELKNKGVVTRGWLGVQIRSVTKGIADSLGPEEHRRCNGGRAAEWKSSGKGRHSIRRCHHRT